MKKYYTIIEVIWIAVFIVGAAMVFAGKYQLAIVLFICSGIVSLTNYIIRLKLDGIKKKSRPDE